MSLRAQYPRGGWRYASIAGPIVAVEVLHIIEADEQWVLACAGDCGTIFLGADPPTAPIMFCGACAGKPAIENPWCTLVWRCGHCWIYTPIASKVCYGCGRERGYKCGRECAPEPFNTDAAPEFGTAQEDA